MNDGNIDIVLGEEILKSMQSLNNLFEGLETRVKGVEVAAVDGFDKVNSSLKLISFNEINDMLGNLSDSLSFTDEIGTLQNDIQRLTGETGEALKSTTKESYRLAEVWDQDAIEIARAANTMTQTIGGSMSENIKLIQDGFEKGSNANGDMLQQIGEYGPLWDQMGLSASEALALMSNASKKGVFDDKGMDAMKEANLSLREMGQAQIDALKGIGIEVEDVSGKTSFEVIQMISKAMKTADTQARQLVLADIFKGAGEDAGLAFIEGLDTMDLTLENIPSVSTFGSSFTSWIAGIKVDIFEFAGDTAAYLQPITDLTRTFNSFMPVVSGVGKMFKWLGKTKLVTAAATKIVTAAQWLWNTAILANPIVAIVLGLTALTIGIFAVTSALSESTAVENANIEMKQRSIDKSADERAELAILMEQLKSTTAESEERKKVAAQLNQMYPETLKNYDLEKASLQQIAAAEREIIKEISNRAEAEAALEMLKEGYKTELEYQTKYKDGMKLSHGSDAVFDLKEYTQALEKRKFLLGKISDDQKSKLGATNIPTELPTATDPDGDDDPDKLNFKNKNLFATKASQNHQMKSLVVNIGTLVGEISIQQSSRAQTKSDIQQQISEALTGAVRDFETSM